MNKKPDWIKVKALSDESYRQISSVSKKYSLHTICKEALCPNINECWSAKTATFLLMGNMCTRNCRFCNVKSGIPESLPDKNEPANIANAVKELGLKYVVLTSVDRDDLPDFGAKHFANVIKEIKNINPDILVEALIPDFEGHTRYLEKVILAKPHVLGHNLETVENLSPKIRDRRANYNTSLYLLKTIKEIAPNILTKSSIQLGFGETEIEVKKTLADLRVNRVDIVTIGQYLQPSEKQLPVVEFINPDKFKEYKEYGENLGIPVVLSTPLVRSSYKAASAIKLS